MILRDRAVAGLLLSEAISTFGSRLTLVALPWFVLATTGSAARMSLVLAMNVVPVAILGSPSGLFVSRFGARRTLLVSDLVRAPLIALIPALHSLGALSFPLLLFLVFVMGVATAPYFASKRLVLPEILGEDERLVAQGHSAIEAANRLTAVLGPIAAGFVIATLGAASVLWLDAASFLASFVLLAALVAEHRRRATPSEKRPTLLAGVGFLAHDRLLGGIALTIVGFGAVWPVVFAALPVLAYTRFGGDPKIAGFLFAAWGAGTLAGSIVSFVAAPRIAPVTLARLALVGVALSLTSLTAAATPWGVATALLVAGLFLSLSNAPMVSLSILRTPPHLRAHVMTAVTTAEELPGPVVLAIAGPVFEAFGARPAFVFVAVGAAVAAATFLAATATPARPPARARRSRSSSCSASPP